MVCICSLKKLQQEVFVGSKYMKSFDDSKPSKFVRYLGANNLYS